VGSHPLLIKEQAAWGNGVGNWRGERRGTGSVAAKRSGWRTRVPDFELCPLQRSLEPRLW